MEKLGLKNLRAVPVADQTAGSENSYDHSFLPDQVASVSGPNLPDAADPSQQPPADDIQLPDQKPSLEGVYGLTAGNDPARSAEVIQFAKRLNEPEAFIDKNLDNVKQAAASPGPSFFTELEKQYPGTTQFLTDPRNMAATHDDIPNVAQHEGVIQTAKDAWEFEKAAFLSGGLQEELAFLQYNKMRGSQQDSDHFRLGPAITTMAGITTTDPNDRIQQINAKMEELSKVRPAGFGVKRGIFGATEFAPQILGGLGYGAKYALPVAGAALLAQQPELVSPAVKAGMTAGEVDYNFKLMTGMSYDALDKIRDNNGQPLPDNIKKIAAYAMGAGTSALSLVKLNTIMNTIPGGKEFISKFTASAGEKVLENPVAYGEALKQFAKNYTTAVAHGVGAMEGITAINIAGTEGAQALSGQQFDQPVDPATGKAISKTSQIFSQLANTAADAATTFGVMALPGTGVGLIHDMSQARKADQARNFYTALGNTAEASKLRERLPESHQEMIANLTKDSPIENVYIPSRDAEIYFQSKNIDTETAMKELGAEKSYAEAKATGGDIQIPLADWVSKVVGTEHYQGLADDIKFSPDDLTKRQAEDRKAEIQQKIKETVTKAEQEQASADGEESAKKISEGIQTQLKAAGVSAQEAKINPQLHEAFFKTLGESLGVDPLELSKKFPLHIGKGEEVAPRAHHQDELSAERIKKEVKSHFTGDEAQEKYEALPETQGGKIVDADTARKLYPPYAESAEGATKHLDHTDEPAGMFAKELYEKKLEKPAKGEAIILGGGSASGKSTWLSRHHDTVDRSDVVYDSTGTNYKYQKQRIEQALDSGRPVRMVYVYQGFEKALDNNANRFKDTGRLVSPDYMAKAHVGALDTFLRLAEEYKNEKAVKFHIVDNSKEGRPEITVAELSEKRYTKEGESVDEAAQRLQPIAEERLANEVKQIEETKQRADLEARNQTGADEEIRRGSQDLQQDSAGRDGIDSQESPENQLKKILEQPGEGAPRGQIRISRDREFNIDLLAGADKSTFLHETGHYFLEVLGDVASQENAPEHITRDFNTILDWLGVKSRDEIGSEQHEKFARGFEAYLMEGHAPTEKLRAAFAKFKAWLVNIYRQLKNLNVELTPEVRGVMDRMLASKDEIAQAQRDIGFHQDLIEGLNPKIAAKIDDLQAKARDAAESALMKEQMTEITAQHEKFLADERVRLAEVAKSQVKELPLFSAIESLKEYPGAKKSQASFAEKFLKGKLNDKDSAHMEMLAEIHYSGADLQHFKDGEDLANQIVAAEKNNTFDKEVASRVAAGMEQHANLMDKASIKVEALKALHNEKMTELLALEHEVLKDLIENSEIKAEVSKRKRAEASLAAKSAKEQSKELLENKPVKDAGAYRTYITAERNAAKRVAVAISRKDFEAAANAKEQQMLSHALAAEAMKNGEVAEKSLRFLAKFEGRTDMMKMPYAFIRQIDQMISGVGLAEPRGEDSASLIQTAKDMTAHGETADEIANATGYMVDQNGSWTAEKLPDFIKRVNENYYSFGVDDAVMALGNKQYKDLSLKELRAVTFAVKSIAEIGKKYNRFLGEFGTIEVRQAAAEIRKSIETNIGSPYADSKKIGSGDGTFKDKTEMAVRRAMDFFAPSSINTLTLSQFLDGGKNDGPVHEYIYRPLKNAEDSKFARYQAMKNQIAELFGKFYTPKELAELKSAKSEQMYEGVGRKLTREEVLSIALNWGNEGNRDRIRTGYGLEDHQVQSILDTMSKKEWDLTQAMWDHLDSYWPEIQALEMKINGVEPGRVDPSVVHTLHGDYRGGYYPIAYDFEKSTDAYKTAEQKSELYKQFSTASAHTDQGHAQARTAYVNRPIRLSFDVFFNHLENVVHDLEFRPAVIDVSRLLRSPDVKSSIENALGIQGSKTFGDWVKSVASDQSENLSYVQKALQWTRFRATIATLALRPIAFLRHLPGNIHNGALEIGAQRMLGSMVSGLTGMVTGKGELKDFVFERSDRMKQRLTIRDRDIADMARTAGGAEKSFVIQYGFIFQHSVDEAVALPLWSEVYRQHLDEHGEQKAIDLADEAVTRALGSGSYVDRIGAQRGGEGMKLFTMNYSWMSVMMNRAWLQGKMAGLEYNQGNVGKAVATMAKAGVLLWAMPAVYEILAEEASRNVIGNGGTSDERNKRMLVRLLEGPFSYVLGLRDIAPPLIHRALNEPGNADFKMSPVETAFQNLITPAGDTMKLAFTHGKHVDERYLEEVMHGASQLTGYPQQLNTWAFNLIDDIQNNGETTWRDLMSRKKKK